MTSGARTVVSGARPIIGVTSFTTMTLPPQRRRLFWRDLVAETFPGMVAEVPDAIRADLALLSLGQVGIARARSARAHVRRPADDHRAPSLLLHLQRRGQLIFAHGDRSVVAAAGDIVVVDDTQPYAIDISDRNDCLILQLPTAMLGDADGTDSRGWHGLRLDRRAPATTMLRQMLDSLWSQRDRLGDGAAGYDTVLAAAAALACRNAARPAIASTASPLDYVRRNLTDPALTTATIARATGLSTRGVQKSFARQIAQTPTAYITEQRLARAATLLTATANRSVTEVAYEVGFNDSAFFSRCFRTRYGMTPRDWRASMPAGVTGGQLL